jgi:large subunit ribosomal protein L18
MTAIARERRESRVRRHERIRKKMEGTPDCPRLCVFRSHKHIYGAIVDDTAGKTLLTVGSLAEDVVSRASTLADMKGKTGRARAVGLVLAEKAKEKGLTRVRFDRGGYIYHGRVKALADGAREGGLEF